MKMMDEKTRLDLNPELDRAHEKLATSVFCDHCQAEHRVIESIGTEIACSCGAKGRYIRFQGGKTVGWFWDLMGTRTGGGVMVPTITRCPICGDFDIGDWCNHCQVATVEEQIGYGLSPEEQAEADHYFDKEYEAFINHYFDGEYEAYINSLQESDEEVE
jgi:hypothetical protein